MARPDNSEHFGSKKKRLKNHHKLGVTQTGENFKGQSRKQKDARSESSNSLLVFSRFFFPRSALLDQDRLHWDAERHGLEHELTNTSRSLTPNSNIFHFKLLSNKQSLKPYQKQQKKHILIIHWNFKINFMDKIYQAIKPIGLFLHNSILSDLWYLWCFSLWSNELWAVPENEHVGLFEHRYDAPPQASMRWKLKAEIFL